MLAYIKHCVLQMKRPIPHFVLVLLFSVCSVVAQQGTANMESAARNDEKRTIVEENADVRITRINAPAGAPESVATRGLDAVIVPLSELSLQSGSAEVLTLKKGEAHFIERDKKYVATGTAIVVELKEHWDRPVKYCATPA